MAQATTTTAPATPHMAPSPTQAHPTEPPAPVLVDGILPWYLTKLYGTGVADADKAAAMKAAAEGRKLAAALRHASTTGPHMLDGNGDVADEKNGKPDAKPADAKAPAAH